MFPPVHGALSSALHFLLVSCGFRHLSLVLSVLPIFAIFCGGVWVAWLGVVSGAWLFALFLVAALAAFLWQVVA
jgi:hypothetical protein